jgi:DNA-binding transcriptional regulator LsrR (DeoR family)
MTTEAQWGSAQLMTKVALLYHEGGMRQSQIAERLHLSQPTVSRLLSRARAAGIVRTSVVPPAGIHSELEDALQQAFGLLDAVVVDDAPAGRDPDADLGARASAYLQATLSGVPILGISSWSATLLGAASALSPAASDARRAGATGQVVQLVGGHGDPRVQAEAARLLTLLADAMGARPVALPAPGALASRAARDALIADPALAPVVALWSEAWGLEDQAELSGRGAVGDICQRFIDAAGSPVASDLDDRVVGIDLEAFRRIPRRVAVAGGETKVAAIRAALRGGWINVLVTNLSSAQALVV